MLLGSGVDAFVSWLLLATKSTQMRPEPCRVSPENPSCVAGQMRGHAVLAHTGRSSLMHLVGAEWPMDSQEKA